MQADQKMQDTSQKEKSELQTTSGANCLMISSCPQSGAKRKVVVKNVLRLLERMHVCVRVQTADCSDKTCMA